MWRRKSIQYGEKNLDWQLSAQTNINDQSEGRIKRAIEKKKGRSTQRLTKKAIIIERERVGKIEIGRKREGKVKVKVKGEIERKVNG